MNNQNVHIRFLLAVLFGINKLKISCKKYFGDASNAQIAEGIQKLPEWTKLEQQNPNLAAQLRKQLLEWKPRHNNFFDWLFNPESLCNTFNQPLK
jgi:hypothetical protein